MQQALHFGAGNIGRGFIGKLLADSGFKVIFVDVNERVIDLLNQQHSYNVKVVSESQNSIEPVYNVEAIHSNQQAQLVKKITEVNVITTAVGPSVLKFIAPVLANGLSARLASGNHTPINIIACENMVRGSSALKDLVYSHLSTEQQQKLDTFVGFVDSAVDRIVPPVQADEQDPLQVTVEEFSEWIVDATQFKGDIPTIKGMDQTDNLMAFVERKLFTLNTGHAVTAYLGKLKGYAYIKQAIDDVDIKQQVKAVMLESGAVLIKRYGFAENAHHAYIEKILGRFANPYLQDEVDRVGREPIRKLSYNDRLIKPLRGTLEYALSNDNLIQAIAAALKYQNASDPQAVELQQTIASIGVEKAVAQYTQLTDPQIISKIVTAYNTTF